MASQEAGRGRRAELLRGPVGTAAGQADEESLEEDPQEPLGDPGQDREDREADELPEREPQEGTLDDRRKQVQQPAGVPGERRFVQGPGGADGTPRDPPGEVAAALQAEFRKPDRERSEGGLPALGIDVLRIGRDAVHADEQAAAVEDGLELGRRETAFVLRHARVEIERGGDGVPGDLVLQLPAEERAEGGAGAAEVLRNLGSGTLLGARGGGEQGEQDRCPEEGLLDQVAHVGGGTRAAYAWQDSNLRPTD